MPVVSPWYTRLNKKIIRIVMLLMHRMTFRSADTGFDIRSETIRKILLVRATFRLGDSILATPAISLFRENFPNARIDFVGSSISKALFQNLPIDHHYEISRRFPEASWAYARLIKRIRSVGYDMAIDVSCTGSAMGAFIVGFSGARLRIGVRGRKDRWYNVRVARSADRNRYKTLHALIAELGLRPAPVYPVLALSSEEEAEGDRALRAMVRPGDDPVVGIFVGGRISWGKRWPARYFVELVKALVARAARIVLFVGPDERDLIGFFEQRLDQGVPIVYTPSLRRFASMVRRCDLFVSNDSGPMHLACALKVRTIGIFRKNDHRHWGPPPALGRIVYQPSECSADEVLQACCLELPQLGTSAFSEPASKKSLPTKLSSLKQSLFFGGYIQALFFLGIFIHAWLFPPSGLFAEGTWSETFTDGLGLLTLSFGALLRVWAASHAGKNTWPHRLESSELIMSGPFAYVRHPNYTADFLIGLGIAFISEAFVLVPVLVALFILQHQIIVAAEAGFLMGRFGSDFDVYRLTIPKYIPRILPKEFSFGQRLPLNVLGNVLAIMIGATFLEYIESPVHHTLIVHLLHSFVR